MYFIRKFISFLIQVCSSEKKEEKTRSDVVLLFHPANFLSISFSRICLSLSLLSCKCPKLKEGRKIQRDREKKEEEMEKKGQKTRKTKSFFFSLLSFLSNSLQLSLSFLWSLLVGNNTFTLSSFFRRPTFRTLSQVFQSEIRHLFFFQSSSPFFFVSSSTFLQLSLSLSLSHILEVQFRRVTSS